MNKHYKGRLQRGIHEKRIWKKAEAWLTGLLVLVTLLAGCGGPSQGNSFTAGGTAASASPAVENKTDAAAASGDTSGKADLTLMMYLCGSDLPGALRNGRTVFLMMRQLCIHSLQISSGKKQKPFPLRSRMTHPQIWEKQKL